MRQSAIAMGEHGRPNVGELKNLSIDTACLLVQDVQRSLDFYVNRMGMTPTRVNKGFANIQGAGADLAIWEVAQVENALGYRSADLTDSFQGTIVACHVESMGAVDDQYLKLKERGIEFLGRPRVYDWNAYAVYFADPDGNLWEIYTWAERGPPDDIPVDEA